MKQNAQNTITFIPDRLNRRPVVLGGMVIDEIFLLLGLGFGLGVVIGFFLSILFDLDVVFIFIVGLACSPILVWIGSKVLTRLKRGKPEGWLERMIALKTKPALFITTDKKWSIKRSPKTLK